MALLSSRSIKRPGDSGHRMTFREVDPGTGFSPWWEMYCSCGAWQHGTKEEVEHTAAEHRVAHGEPAP